MITKTNKARLDPWADVAFPVFRTSSWLQWSWLEWPDSSIWFTISFSWKDSNEVGLSSSSSAGFIRSSLGDSFILNGLPVEMVTSIHKWIPCDFLKWLSKVCYVCPGCSFIPDVLRKGSRFLHERGLEGAAEIKFIVISWSYQNTLFWIVWELIKQEAKTHLAECIIPISNTVEKYRKRIFYFNAPSVLFCEYPKNSRWLWLETRITSCSSELETSCPCAYT